LGQTEPSIIRNFGPLLPPRRVGAVGQYWF